MHSISMMRQMGKTGVAIVIKDIIMPVKAFMGILFTISEFAGVMRKMKASRRMPKITVSTVIFFLVCRSYLMVVFFINLRYRLEGAKSRERFRVIYVLF